MPRVLELTGQQQRKLKEALLSAFESYPELSEMILQLNQKLPNISSPVNSLNTNVLEVISWASSRGMLAELIAAARNDRPKNQRLSSFAESVDLSAASEGALQKIVSDNALMLDTEVWREKQVRAESRVCRIDRGAEPAGTGFLVGPNLVLTNFHVVEPLINDSSSLGAWRCRFDHRVAADGVAIISGRTVPFSTKEDWLVDHSHFSQYDLQVDPIGDASPNELDFALIRLSEPIGESPVGLSPLAEERHWFTLQNTPMKVDGPRMIAILQHPGGKPMKLAMGMVERLKLNGNGTRVRHTVPTLAGSSGSPIFDQEWNVIAIHHSGDPKTFKPEYNEAIPIELIAARPKVIAALGG